LNIFSGILQIKLSGEEWTTKVYFVDVWHAKKSLKAR